jgi:Ca2+-binding EF-hand superfamily protein
MRTILSVSLLASTLAFGATAFANEPTPPIDPTLQSETKPTFEALDSNQDGQIAKSEVPVEHELNTLFANFDRNADQLLSRSEFDMYAEEEEEEAE